MDCQRVEVHDPSAIKSLKLSRKAFEKRALQKNQRTHVQTSSTHILLVSRRSSLLSKVLVYPGRAQCSGQNTTPALICRQSSMSRAKNVDSNLSLVWDLVGL